MDLQIDDRLYDHTITCRFRKMKKDKKLLKNNKYLLTNELLEDMIEKKRMNCNKRLLIVT